MLKFLEFALSHEFLVNLIGLFCVISSIHCCFRINIALKIILYNIILLRLWTFLVDAPHPSLFLNDGS